MQLRQRQVKFFIFCYNCKGCQCQVQGHQQAIIEYTMLLSIKKNLMVSIDTELRRRCSVCVHIYELDSLLFLTLFFLMPLPFNEYKNEEMEVIWKWIPLTMAIIA